MFITHTHTHSLHTHAQTHTLLHTISLSLHTHTHTHTYTHSLSLSLTHSHSHSLTHTHKYTGTLVQGPVYSWLLVAGFPTSRGSRRWLMRIRSAHLLHAASSWWHYCKGQCQRRDPFPLCPGFRYRERYSGARHGLAGKWILRRGCRLYRCMYGEGMGAISMLDCMWDYG